MAEVLVFCSKTKQISRTEAVGLCDVNLRHPRTHAVGFQTWRREFPIDLPAMKEHRRKQARQDDLAWAMLRYDSGIVTRGHLLRVLAES